LKGIEKKTYVMFEKTALNVEKKESKNIAFRVIINC
jgi:hypothetical protein